MLRVVIDTNVFISAAITRQGNAAQIIENLRDKKFLLITSRDILNETADVLHRPKFRKYIKIEESKRILKTLYKYSFLTPGNIQVSVSSDPDDDIFLACAEEGKADLIVTGDDDLLSLKSYKNFDIVSVSSFLEILRQYEKKK